MNDQSKDFVLTGGYHVDDFYKYVCDTECIRQNKYTKDEMDTLSIDQRLQTQGINWRKINSAGEFSDFFGLAYLKENPIFWLYNKCCGLDENQGYNIYFFAP